VEPTSEPDRATLVSVELKLAHSQAVEFETAPKETPNLQQAMMLVPSCRSTWPSSVAVEQMLIKYNIQLLTFHPKLVAEQFILTDGSSRADHSGGRHSCDPSAQIWHSLVQIHFSHSNLWSNMNRVIFLT
jgi:hypothetical protein